MKTRLKTVASRLLLSLVSTLFAVLLLETGLRTLRPVNFLQPPAYPPPDGYLHRPSSIPGLAYELTPNMETSVLSGVLSKINSHGMRDDEPILDRKKPLRRIVVLGDSFTFGWKVPVEEIFPTLLERRLNESGTRGNAPYEVLNFGVSGYSTRDEAIVLKQKAVAWDPDLVIVGYSLNDPEIDPYLGLHAPFHKPRWWQYSHLLRLVARVQHNWDIQRLGGGDYYRYLHAQQGEKWKSVIGAFREIKEVAWQRGIQVLVVIFPEIQDLPWNVSWAGYPYKGIHEQVSELARNNGFRVLDLTEAYVDYEPRSLVMASSDPHPNRLGHVLAARAIAEKLLAEHSFFFPPRGPGVN